MGRKKTKSSSEEVEEYEVEEVLESRFNRGKKEYRVRWKGFGDDECSWEPESNLGNAIELLDVYKSKLLTEPATNSSSSKKSASSNSKAGSGQSRRQAAASADAADTEEADTGSGSASDAVYKRGSKRSLAKPAAADDDDAEREEPTTGSSNKRTRGGDQPHIWHGSATRGKPLRSHGEDENEDAVADDANADADADAVTTKKSTANASSRRSTGRVSFFSSPTNAKTRQQQSTTTTTGNQSSTRAAKGTAASSSASAAQKKPQQSLATRAARANSGTKTGGIRGASPGRQAVTSRNNTSSAGTSRDRRAIANDKNLFTKDDLSRKFNQVHMYSMQGTVDNSEVAMDASNNLLMQVDYKLSQGGKVLRFTLTIDEIEMLYSGVKDLKSLMETLSQSNAGTDSTVSSAKKTQQKDEEFADDSAVAQTEGDDEMVGTNSIDADKSSRDSRRTRRDAAAAKYKDDDAEADDEKKKDADDEQQEEGRNDDDHASTSSSSKAGKLSAREALKSKGEGESGEVESQNVISGDDGEDLGTRRRVKAADVNGSNEEDGGEMDDDAVKNGGSTSSEKDDSHGGGGGGGMANGHSNSHAESAESAAVSGGKSGIVGKISGQHADQAFSAADLLGGAEE